MEKVKIVIEDLQKIAEMGNILNALLKLAAKDEESNFNEKSNKDKKNEDSTTDNEEGESVEGESTEEEPVEDVAQEEQEVEQPIVDAQVPQETNTPAPQEIGAMSARAFLGPEVFNMAMQGNPNAQDLIGRVAAHIAQVGTDSASNQMDQMIQQQSMSQNEGYAATPDGYAPQEGGVIDPNAVPVDQNGVPIDQNAIPVNSNVAQGVVTPEEDVANDIVPPAAPSKASTGSSIKPNSVNGSQVASQDQNAVKGPVNVNGVNMYDEETVAKLIELAKQGQI
jgi:hypothetical protein